MNVMIAKIPSIVSYTDKDYINEVKQVYDNLRPNAKKYVNSKKFQNIKKSSRKKLSNTYKNKTYDKKKTTKKTTTKPKTGFQRAWYNIKKNLFSLF